MPIPLTELNQSVAAEFGDRAVAETERQVTIHHIDEAGADQLSTVAKVREAIRLVGLGGLKPLNEFRRQVGQAFGELLGHIEDRVLETFSEIQTKHGKIDLDRAGLRGPSSTWTYLVNGRKVGALQQLLFGDGSYATAAGAAIMTGPLIFVWAIRERFSRQ